MGQSGYSYLARNGSSGLGQNGSSGQAQKVAGDVVRNVAIGLAGHIDHGKTALAKALTSVDTDRLKEEKVRGISIEPGFAPYRLPSGHVVSIIDCPGHEKFIKNMLRGISGVDIVILVIAADDGPMPQTREHLDILSLLRIRFGLVVVNKVDLVDRDWLELVHEEVAKLIEPTFLRKTSIIDCSCRTGEGIGQVNTALTELIGKVEKTRLKGEFRLPVDRVFTMAGYGTIATGTLVDGNVRPGSAAMIYPAGCKVKIRGIQVHNQWVEEARTGQRVGFNLAGISTSQIKRGDTIAPPDSLLLPTGILDARLRYLESNASPLVNRTRVRLYTGTTELIARVILMDRDKMQPGEQAIVQFRLEEKASPLVFDRFIIRSLSPQHTIGGGVILDAHPRRYSISESAGSISKGAGSVLKDTSVTSKGTGRIARLELLEQGRFESFVSEIISRHTFTLCTKTELLRKTALTHIELNDILTRLKNKGVLYCLDKDIDKKNGNANGSSYSNSNGIGKNIDKNIDKNKEEFLFASKQAASIKRKITDTLQKFHSQNPLEKGMGKEMLRARTSGEMDIRLFHCLIGDLEARQAIALEGPHVRLADHRPSLNSWQKEIITMMERVFLSSGYQPLKISHLYQNIVNSTHNNSQNGTRNNTHQSSIKNNTICNTQHREEVERLLKMLVSQGVLIRITPDTIIHSQPLNKLKEMITAYIQKEKSLTIADFRSNIADLSRRTTVLILDYLDSIGFTSRTGDIRTLRDPKR
ncbi:MAG: selenocysteine-specific translation elongation factor [bacterium]